MSLRFLSVISALPLALAFSNTAPLVSWSSHSSSSLKALPSKFPHAHALVDAILSGDDICSHDAIVFVEQPELHASDLRTLSPNTHLARALASAPSSRQYPYLPAADEELDLATLLQTAAARCSSTFTSHSLSSAIPLSLEQKQKQVLSLALPPLGSDLAQERKEALGVHDELLSTTLAALAATHPKHLVIYASLPSPAEKRAVSPVLSLLTHRAANGTTTGGILAHYQLLTPGLITTLLVALFVLLPILMFGIQALASIQSPVKTEVPKGYDASERKNQ
ncbi:vacuolar ATP synthase subunit S1-domain-containing protein [Roridomyces roridus]|uniref:Protein BIG1 n=1 Tax=Roridomyces roridus TaxID=1738132 RepID=A0AAD7CIB4_9AGAR|nr:vacuolar ATP synthase subunit S1-domain-containing protein [Roridomyces roridus]